MATQEREVEVFSITQTIDAASMDVSSESGAIKQNEAGEVVFRAVRPLVFDEAVQIPSTGRFVVLDGYDVVGGGIVGAAGGVETAICALAVANGIIPPTINYGTPDPQCDLDFVPNAARRADLRVALSNAFGFGGHNTILALKRWG